MLFRSKILVMGNLHTPSSTLSSVLLASDDAGATWREPLPRSALVGLEAAQFLDAQNGWIVAQPQGAVPHDPYLLGTADGGATWRKLSLWGDEARAGLLQQFYFDSKDHGWALVDRSAAGAKTDRYELYETVTGGNSWMLRESSARPIQTKWPPRPAPPFRLREDPKLKTYEVERRAGEDWTRVANFNTELGACRAIEPPPAPKKEPAEPPPPVLNH